MIVNEEYSNEGARCIYICSMIPNPTDTRTSRRTVLTAIGGGVGASLLGATGSAAAQQDQDDGGGDLPYICAHRGFRDLFPQNTVAAVAGATELGAPRIEIDLEATGDGDIVVFHDARLDELTDMEGLVAEMSTDEVTQAEVLDSGQTVPTLAETLDAAGSDVLMNLEFKDRGQLTWEEFTQRTLEIAADFPGDFYASSFDHDAIRAVRAVDPEVDVAPIFGDEPLANVEVARELDAEALNCSLDVLSQELVEIAHEEDRAVNVWTIDNWREAAEAIELGVDGLIADYTHLTAFAAMTAGEGTPTPSNGTPTPGNGTPTPGNGE